MAGLYLIYSQKRANLPTSNYSRFYSSTFPHTLNEEITSSNLVYGRSVPNKFLDDRFLYEDEEMIIGVDGIIYQMENPRIEIPTLFKKKGASFVENLKGQFSGFIFDKKKRRVSIFTDQVSSKPLYYTIHAKSGFLSIASEAKVLSSLLHDLHLSVNLDLDSIKSLLCMGYLMGNYTPVTEIRKVPYGSIVHIDLHNFHCQTESYFKLESNINKDKKSEIIEKIDSLLLNSIKNEWDKDIQYGLKHFSFLSGGLDSRVNLLLANKLGYSNIHTLTFAEKSSRDHTIANQIAQQFAFNHTSKILDGTYLLHRASDYVKANDGLASYLAAAHLFYSVKDISFEQFGSVHSGQIGDILFGSSSNKEMVSMENVFKYGFVKHPNLVHSIERLPEILKNYQYEGGSEIFSYEQRQFNGTFNGDRTSSHFYDQASPFYDKALIQYCLSIPKSYKENENIYLDWFNKKHPVVAKFKWQRTSYKPTSAFKTKIGINKRRVLSRIYSMAGMQYDSMNPFEFWFKKNPDLIRYFDSLFEQNLNLLGDEELKKMATSVYQTNIPNNMVAVVSALLSVKLYLNKLE